MNEMTDQKTHVVVTRYKTLVHAYGPFTKKRAREVARKMRKEHQDSQPDVQINVCKMIDVITLSDKDSQ